MANKPIANPPAADLPENWVNGQIVSVNGIAGGMSEKHGYNYLMQKVNAGVTALGVINDAFAPLAELEDGRISPDTLPPLVFLGNAELSIPASAWESDGGGGYTATVTVPELAGVENPVILVDISSAAQGVNADTIDAWALVGTIADTVSGDVPALSFRCFDTAPGVALPLQATWVAFNTEYTPPGGATEPYAEYGYDAYGTVETLTFHGDVPAYFSSNGWTRVVIADGCATIGKSAFNSSQIVSVEIPQSVKLISEQAFRYCQSLTSIIGMEGVEELGEASFSYCAALTAFTVPATVQVIRSNILQGATRVTTVNFRGKPRTIDRTAFYGASGLTTINVPWAEGEVANAPWGANNATINYNVAPEA